MKAKPFSRRQTSLIFTFFSLMLLTPTLQAARVVNGALGHWISSEASPLLAELLTNHPRFRGEKIKIMAMQDGHPTRIKNGLTEQVRKQLTEDLLTQADVKIVFDDNNRCLPIKVNTILGIEIERHDKRNHNQKYRVSLAFVDIDEGIWLNGTNISWVGRATNDQQRAYQSIPVRAGQVSVYHPSEFTEMANALHDQLKCNETIAAPIFFAPQEDELSRRVLRKLRERIAHRALITLDKTLAASVITLTRPNLKGPVGPLFLEASDTNTPDQSMRVAEIKVSNTYRPRLTTPSPGDSLNLISEIRIHEERSSGDVCKGKKKGCLPVSFNLNQPAYTMLFYTIRGKATLLNCEVPNQQATGKYDYGLNVPGQDSLSLPGLGFYALAFKDRKTARSFYQLLKQNVAGCGSANHSNNYQDGAQDIVWLSSLENLIHQYETKIDWTAIHLAWQDNRLRQL